MSFRAICDAFKELAHDDFHWGHPRSRFESSLSWRSGYWPIGLRRRLEQTTLKMTSLHQRVKLPSWSWMGWVGPVDYSVTDEKLDLLVLSSNSKLFCIRLTISSEQPTITCFIHKCNPLRLSEICPTHEFEVRQDTQQQLKPMKSRTKEVVLWEDVCTHLPLINEERLSGIPNQHLLFFWTTTAHFEVEAQTHIQQYEGAHDYRGAGDDISLKNDTGSVVGKVCKLGVQEDSDIFGKSTRAEFAIIGKRSVPGVEGTSLIIALQLKWEGDIAVRMNIAEINEDAWADGHPTRRLIALL